MTVAFYFSAVIAVLSTALAITRANAVHALLYMITSLFSVAVVFYTLGAPFVAALEVIVYAGAIMVLFAFAIMMLNPGAPEHHEREVLLSPDTWAGPAFIALILLAELIYIFVAAGNVPLAGIIVEPKQVGLTLYSSYILAVELASMLLLAGLVGASHLGVRTLIGRGPKRGAGSPDEGKGQGGETDSDRGVM